MIASAMGNKFIRKNFSQICKFFFFLSVVQQEEPFSQTQSHITKAANH